jgi:hypothetical protein
MKTLVALLILLISAPAFAQTYNPWIGQSVPTVQQQLDAQVLSTIIHGYGINTVVPSGPTTGTVIGPTGRMTPYIVSPSPGVRYNLDSRGRIGIQYDFGNGMVMDLD